MICHTDHISEEDGVRPTLHIVIFIKSNWLRCQYSAPPSVFHLVDVLVENLRPSSGRERDRARTARFAASCAGDPLMRSCRGQSLESRTFEYPAHISYCKRTAPLTNRLSTQGLLRSRSGCVQRAVSLSHRDVACTGAGL